MPCGRKTLQSYGEKQTFPNFVCSLTFVNLVAALCGSLVCHLRGFLPESECKVTAFFPKNQIFWQEFYVIKHIFCRRVLAYLAYLADLQDGAQRRGRRTFLRGFHTTVLRTRRLAPKRHQTTIRHMGPGCRLRLSDDSDGTLLTQSLYLHGRRGRTTGASLLVFNGL